MRHIYIISYDTQTLVSYSFNGLISVHKFYLAMYFLALPSRTISNIIEGMELLDHELEPKKLHQNKLTSKFLISGVQ